MAGEGTILAAVLRDGNGKIQLLGYQLCHGETKENWTAFLQALRDGAGLTRETLFFADRPPYLLNCFRSVFGEDFQYFGCLQHLVRDATNWCRSAGLSLAETKHMKALIKHAAYAPTEEDHQAFMDQIRKGCPRVYRHLNSVETLWAGIQSTDRFGYMTSNNIESFNALIKRDVGTVIPIRSMRVFRAAIALYNLYCKQILFSLQNLLIFRRRRTRYVLPHMLRISSMRIWMSSRRRSIRLIPNILVWRCMVVSGSSTPWTSRTRHAHADTIKI